MVGFLDAGSLSKAIEGPAALAGIRLAPDLAARIVAESSGHGEAIPLAADLLWRIVTLEDLVEELVGEIYDETDCDVAQATHEPDGSILMPGHLPRARPRRPRRGAGPDR